MQLWQIWFCVIIMALIGVYCIAAAFCNWDWFFTNRRARGLVRLFGRNGARIFYGALGVVIIVLSIIAAADKFL